MYKYIRLAGSTATLPRGKMIYDIDQNLKGNSHQKKVPYLCFLTDTPSEMMNFKIKLGEKLVKPLGIYQAFCISAVLVILLVKASSGFDRSRDYRVNNTPPDIPVQHRCL